MPERSRRLKGLVKRAFEMYEVGKDENTDGLSPKQIADYHQTRLNVEGTWTQDEIVANFLMQSKIQRQVESTTLALRIARDWDEIYGTDVREIILSKVYSEPQEFDLSWLEE